MENNLANLMSFMKFLEDFRRVKRTGYLIGSKEMENDVEHSYQLAMVAWYIISTKKLKLDLEKIFRYCLAHDVVETYAGDTYAYTTDQDLLGSKKDREHESSERIKREFPNFSEMHESIHSYELREDEESKFVYALDKLMPCLNTFIDNGNFWQEYKVTFKMWQDVKQAKMESHPEVKKFLDEMKPTLEGLFFKE